MKVFQEKVGTARPDPGRVTLTATFPNCLDVGLHVATAPGVRCLLTLDVDRTRSVRRYYIGRLWVANP